MREKLLQKHLLCKKGRKAKLAKLLWMNMHSCTQQEMLILKEPKINNLNSVWLPGPSSPFWKWTRHSSPILLRVMGYMGQSASKSAKELVRSQNWSEGKIWRSHQAFIYSQGTWASQQVSYLEPSFLTHHLSWWWWHHNRSEKLNGRNISLPFRRDDPPICSAARL